MVTDGDTVAARLRAAIDENGFSIRETSRRLAAVTGNKPESEKRKLERILSGVHEPERDTAEELAQVLGGDPSLYEGGRRSRAQSLADLHARIGELTELTADLVSLVEQLTPATPLSSSPEWLPRRLEELEARFDARGATIEAGLAEVRRVVELLATSLPVNQLPPAVEQPQSQDRQR